MFSGDTADCDRAPIELEAGLEVSLALRQRDQDPESVLPFVRIRLEETRQLDALVTVNDWMRSLTFFVGTVISSEGVSFDRTARCSAEYLRTGLPRSLRVGRAAKLQGDSSMPR